MNKLLFIAVLSFVFISLIAQNTISLEEAITMARENNLSLQSNYYQMEASRWTYENSRAQFLPKLNLSATTLILDKEQSIDLGFAQMTLQDKNTYSLGLSAEQVFFAGGRIYRFNNISKLQYEMSQNNYRKALLDTDNRVTELYYTLLQTLSAYEILRLHLELCHDIKDNTQVLFNNGIGLETDIMLWELRIIEIENQRNSVWNAIVNLEQLWGLTLGIDDIYNIPLPEIVDIEDILIEIREFSLLGNEQKRDKMNDYLSKVNQNNIDLLNLSKSKEILYHYNRIAAADFMPTLFASFNMDLGTASDISDMGKAFQEDNTWQIMANINIPLFHGFRNITNYRAREYEIRSQTRMLEEGTKGLDIQSRQIWYDFDNATNNVIQLEKYYNLAERSLGIIRNLHNEGMATNVTLQDAQNSALAANLQFINSIYDYVNIKNKLNSFTGE